jgi:hypothetical protein
MPLFGSRPARITESGYNVGEKFHAAGLKLRVQIPSVETLGYDQIKSIYL